MARTVLKWSDGLIEFDAVEVEAPHHEVAVTEYPVEMGANLIDHIRVRPPTMRLTAFVSNTPARDPRSLTHLDGAQFTQEYAVFAPQPIINMPPAAQLPASVAGQQLTRNVPHLGSVRTLVRGTSVNRVNSIYVALQLAMASAREFTIATDVLGDFDQMLLRSLNTERDSRSGNSMRLVMEFQKLLYASLASRDVSHLMPKKPKEKRSAPPKDEGKKDETVDEKTEEVAERTLAHWGLF